MFWKTKARRCSVSSHGMRVCRLLRSAPGDPRNVAGGFSTARKPADLPVVQSTKFELVINDHTAGLLGLKILAPGPSCLAPTPQLKRESSLVASFGRANGNYHNISNTWLAHGFLSSNPLSPFFMSSEQFCTDSHWQWALGEGQVGLSYTLA
jgi:hypothetical protein